MQLLKTSDPAADRRLNLLLGVAVITAVASILIAVLGIPKILSNASATSAIKEGNELTACRAGYRAEIDDASARLQAARARLDSLTNAGLEAVARRDPAALGEIVPDLPAARQDVEEQVGRLELAAERYSALVGLSRTDPEKFLRRCREDAA